MLNRRYLKALTHGAIFLATCKAILLLGDVKLANTSFHHRLLIYSGYIVMLRARMFSSLIISTGIKERNIRARNITVELRCKKNCTV